MSYRNGRLANGFLSLDRLGEEIDLVKSRVVSDEGLGVARMVAAIDLSGGYADTRVRERDGTTEVVDSEDGGAAMAREARAFAANRLRRFHAAEMKLRRAGLGYLLPTLALICKNGRYRNESIREIAARRNISFGAAKARYFAHREILCKIILDQ